MKKILIVNNNLHIGGVQKALVSLLWSVRERYDVTLLLFYKGGQCLQDLPPEIKVIQPRSAYRYLGMTKYDTLSLWEKMGRSFFAAVTRIFGRNFAIRLMAPGQRQLKGYDVAISYLHNGADKAFYGGCNDFVLNHVAAQKKIAFLHCDYVGCGADTRQNARQYARFDTVAACSQGCADSFAQSLPELAGKVMVVPNCHRFDHIVRQAEAAPVTVSEKINLVTVARLGKEKGVERAVRAISHMGAAGEKLHYYILGDGIQKPLLQQIIKEEKLEDRVTLCGMLENPYGYIRAADLLLIPSYSEAAPLVIGEAACLGTPVLSTQTSSAEEMISQNGLGWVCPNSENALQTALEALVAEPGMIADKKAKLANATQNNDKAMAQFARMIES